MDAHLDLRQCRDNLYQQECDEEWEESFEIETERLGRRPERPNGNCAIVSLVHATFREPRGEAYREAKRELEMAIVKGGVKGLLRKSDCPSVKGEGRFTEPPATSRR